MASIKGKNILVTGGAGFIGSHLCDGLLIKGAGKVVCVDNFFLGKMENLELALQNNNFVLYRDDARNFGVLQSIMEREDIDVVFNMATIALNYSFFNPFDAYMVNVQIANTLLELLKVGAYKTLIHTSSSEAYGTAQYSPMDENHPTDPTTPYAAGKAAADLMVHSFYKVLGLDISIVRPFNNYGPRQNAVGSLAAIIPATARRIREGGMPVVEGDGEQTRDFIYVTDTVRGLILAYEKEESRGKIINLGSGKDISINALLNGICKYMNYTGMWEHRPARTSDVRNLCADSKRAKMLLGFETEVGFEEGIEKNSGLVYAAELGGTVLDQIQFTERFDEYMCKKREEMKAKYNRVLPSGELIFNRFDKATYLKCGNNSSIYDTSVVMGDVIIGDNVWIGPYTLLEGSTDQLIIGNFVSIDAGVMIYTHDSTKYYVSGGKEPFAKGPVTIGDNTVIGTMSMIGCNVSIGKHCVVGAHSFVNRDVPDNTIVAGVPAKIIGRVILDEKGVHFEYFRE